MEKLNKEKRKETRDRDVQRKKEKKVKKIYSKVNKRKEAMSFDVSKITLGDPEYDLFAKDSSSDDGATGFTKDSSSDDETTESTTSSDEPAKERETEFATGLDEAQKEGEFEHPIQNSVSEEQKPTSTSTITSSGPLPMETPKKVTIMLELNRTIEYDECQPLPNSPMGTMKPDKGILKPRFSTMPKMLIKRQLD